MRALLMKISKGSRVCLVVSVTVREGALIHALQVIGPALLSYTNGLGGWLLGCPRDRNVDRDAQTTRFSGFRGMSVCV